MSRQLTQAQEIATRPNISARVMANAGSGKTSVLTARVLRLLLDGNHPSKILCLTYTKAAAAEMRERISKKLEQWVLMDDSELRADMQASLGTTPDEKQMLIAKQLFSKTLESSPPPRIQTIHSFCQDVLKRFPLESGIQPYFEVVDDITARELIKETTQVLLSKDRQATPVSEAISYIAAEAGEWKFNEVINEIIQQRNRIRDLFDAAGSAENLISLAYKANDFDKEFSLQNYLAEFMQFPPEKSAALKNLNSILCSGGSRDCKFGESLTQAIASRKFADYYKVFMKDDGEPYFMSYFISKASLAKFAQGAEWIMHEQQVLSEIHNKRLAYDNLLFTKHVIHLANGILESYEQIKRNRAVIDYNDLIYTTKKLLTSHGNAPWVLYKLDGGIDHILIDEAQDTSPDQWEIVTALMEEFFSGEGAAKNSRTVFIVGDEKQSIYSFQGANQESFASVLESVRRKTVDAQKEYSDIAIKMSFRSVEAVLKLVDTTFEPEFLRKSITTQNQVSHEISRLGEGGRVEIWPIIQNEEREELENWQLPLQYHTAKSADFILAEKIADTIASWLKNGRILTAKNRPVKASDILILLRSRGEMADMLINRLKRRGVPVSGSDRLKITEHIAVQDLLSLSNFLLLPNDDLSLAEALKSPLFGITEEELFELCHKRPGSLWNSLRNNPKFSATAEMLQELMNKVDYLSVYSLYSTVLDLQGGRKKLIQRLGHEVNDVLDEFLDLAVNFERSHTNSLQQFINWVCLSNMEIKRDMEQAGDQVRIMTVHGSKGLEAPIVFLADAAKRPQSKRQLIWSDGLFYAAKSKTLLYSKLRTASDNADAADYDEYLRLLYVALTRARDELYITGSVGERNVDIDKSWYRIVENSMSKIGMKDDESGVISFVTEGTKTSAEKPLPQPLQHEKLPSWKKLPVEKPRFIEVENLELQDYHEEISLGKRVHKALELIGNLPEEKRRLYLEHEFAGEPEIAQKLIELISGQYKYIFSASAKSEVPVIGKVNGEIITGRIDRLLVSPDKVTIIDFKTARKIPAQVPEKYIKQLDIYKQILQSQYPGRVIETAILWTSGPKLMLLD